MTGLGIDDHSLSELLREDVPFGDLTTSGLGIAGLPGEASFHARGPMVVCGTEAAARLFTLAGATAEVCCTRGAKAAPGQLLLRAQGPTGALHTAWKTAQTLAEALSGIATATDAIVQTVRAAGFDIPVACTRKNFPGTRRWSALAVRAGGGVMHRLGLSETLLVFPEHLAFVSPGDRAAALSALRRAQPEKRLVVEVGGEDDALAMAHAGADVLQLERFTPDRLAALRQKLHTQGWRVKLAPAGGVTAANAAAYATAGADFLVTSAPYFAPPADIRVSLGPAAGCRRQVS